MSDETFNGYKNRETWAFNLHWQNDRGLYETTLAEAADLFQRQNIARVTDEPVSDWELGEFVVEFWRDRIDESRREFSDGIALEATLYMFEREVGSWWRIDYAEVGAAVRESLDVEA